ncbi:MAG: DUF3168 domain-containing protein [Thermoanaerobaculia bacterium]
MSSASLALQKALRTALTDDSALGALVGDDAILDRHGRPETFPVVLIGEDQEISENLTPPRSEITVFSTLHVWDREPGFASVKNIAGAIRDVVQAGLGALDAPFRLLDVTFQSARFLRDPDGETSHAVLTTEAIIEEDG